MTDEFRTQLSRRTQIKRAIAAAGRRRKIPMAPEDGHRGLDHPRKFFDLTEGLIRRGYPGRLIEGILGGNFKRAVLQIWR